MDDLGIVPTDVAQKLAIKNGWIVRSNGRGGFEPCQIGERGWLPDANRVADAYWWDERTKTAAPVTAEQRKKRGQ